MAGLLRRYKSPLYGNYRKYSLLYGAVSGAVLFVFVVVSYLAGSPISTPETYGTDAVLAVCIFVSSYLYRERQTGGKIFLKELLVLGMGIGVVAGAVYGGLLLAYGGVVDADFCGRCINARIDMMPNESAEDMLAISSVKEYSLGDWAFIGGFRTFVMSIIITFFSAIVFRTEQSIRRKK